MPETSQTPTDILTSPEFIEKAQAVYIGLYDVLERQAVVIPNRVKEHEIEGIRFDLPYHPMFKVGGLLISADDSEPSSRSPLRLTLEPRDYKATKGTRPQIKATLMPEGTLSPQYDYLGNIDIAALTDFVNRFDNTYAPELEEAEAFVQLRVPLPRIRPKRSRTLGKLLGRTATGS
jgi:hypothetical protein